MMSRDARRRAKEMVTSEPVKTVKKPIGGDKNGGFRMVVVNKGPKWYPADDVKKPVPSRKHVHKPTKLRSSIKPGTVLILLSGAYMGSRVVFLKQLDSGLLLVTGPYAVNRIPLTRVNQAYVIATSTVIDVSGADVSKIGDDYFKKDKKSKEKKAEVMEVDTEGGDKKGTSPDAAAKAETQMALDAKIVASVEKEGLLSSYMKAKFSLKKGQYPHEMKF